MPLKNRQPLIGFGQVRHTRLRPSHHAFEYSTFFLLLPMRSLAKEASKVLAINRPALLSFHDKDHGDGRDSSAGGALAWLDTLLCGEGIDDATGEVWLQCYPRILGFTFKPVSFWYCYHPSGDLRAIVVEVNNTFGERHCYLIDQPQWGVDHMAKKVFHVSPFCQVAGQYRFRFMQTRDRIIARIDHDDELGPLIQTSVGGRLVALTPQSQVHALVKFPLMTLMVVLRIHWQAFKLWRKRVRFFTKPSPPQDFVTR
jgi:DUF1365 family protein